MMKYEIVKGSDIPFVKIPYGFSFFESLSLLGFLQLFGNFQLPQITNNYLHNSIFGGSANQTNLSPLSGIATEEQGLHRTNQKGAKTRVTDMQGYYKALYNILGICFFLWIVVLILVFAHSLFRFFFSGGSSHSQISNF